MPTFATLDSLHLAATMFHLGNKIEKAEELESGLMHFHFEDTSKLQKDIADFWMHKLKVDPNLLWEDFKTLKKTYLRQ